MKTSFDSTHPFRRFITPFVYGTVTVNDNARAMLVSPGGFGPRCFALTAEGIGAPVDRRRTPVALPPRLSVRLYRPSARRPSPAAFAWQAASELSLSMPLLAASLATGLSALERRAALSNTSFAVQYWRSRGLSTPFWDQAHRMFGIFYRFVDGYLNVHYASPLEMASDDQMMAHMMHMSKLAGVHTSVEEWRSNPDWFRRILMLGTVRLMEAVTWLHAHVGLVSSYGKDVSFTSFAWPADELQGTRQTAIRQAALTTFTSMAMPKLMVAPGSDGDWSLTLFEKEPKTGKVRRELRCVAMAVSRLDPRPRSPPRRHRNTIPSSLPPPPSASSSVAHARSTRPHESRPSDTVPAVAHSFMAQAALRDVSGRARGAERRRAALQRRGVGAPLSVQLHDACVRSRGDGHVHFGLTTGTAVYEV